MVVTGGSNILILFIIGIFIIINMAIGLWSARKTKDTATYMTADRKMGLGSLVFATFATSVGAGDMLAYPALGYLQGWSSLHFIFAMPVVLIIMAFTVGKR